MRRLPVAVVAIAVLGCLGAGGYALGHSQAADKDEAGEAAQIAFDEAFDEARRTAAVGAEQSGQRDGADQGARAGREAGAAAGTRKASADVDRAQTKIAAAQSAAAEAAAAEAASQEVFCPLSADSSATAADCAALAAEESRCGGFDPDQVQPDGSYLPKPGC